MNINKMKNPEKSEQLNSYYWSRDAYRFDLQDGSHKKKSYDKEYYVRCINHN